MQQTTPPSAATPIAWSLALSLITCLASASAQDQIQVHTATVAFTPWEAPMGPFPNQPAAEPHHGPLPKIPIGTGTMEGTKCPEVVPAGATSPAAFTTYRNTIVKPAGSQTSNVGEPSTSHLGTGAFMTGNWYAASSANDGATWTYVNPYTKFASVDGGFCCDQYTIAAPAHNVVIWELLYSYSATTQKNTIRLAVMSGAANVGTATVLGSYSITSQTLGYPAGTWIDYTQLAKTDKWLYMTGNVFNGAGAYQGSTVSRYDLAAMSVGGTISIQAYNPVGGSPRCSNIVSGTRMHIAHHNSTTSIKLATWDDVGGGPTSVDRTIPTWYAGMTPQPGPDGKDFLARSDNRILTGYQNSRELAFYWNSNLGGSFTRPFVRGVVFDLALNYKRDDNIAASANAWGYPATAVNIAGHVGYVISYGGGAFFPGANIFLRDNVNCFPENAVAASGNAGPDSGLGDYQQVQVHPNLMTFVAACIAQVGGTTNAFSEPRNVHFGRTTTIPTLFDLSVNSVVPSGASVTVNVADNFCEANGTTPFTRTYNSGSGVTLTAPATLGSRAFYRWRLDGVDQGLGVTALGVSMTAAHTASAVYGVFTTPVATAFGTPCLGAGGLPTLTIAAPILIGTNFQHKLTNGPVNKPAYLALGASRTSWPPLTLPFVLPGTTCSVYTDTLITLGTVVPAGGIVFWNLAMPNDVTLLGGKLYTQDINIDIGANSWNLTLSNALELTIGGWNLL